MMKKQWIAPRAEGQRFLANEYVAACEYTIEKVPAYRVDGHFRKDADGDGIYNPKVDKEPYYFAWPGCTTNEELGSFPDKPDVLWYFEGKNDNNPEKVFYWNTEKAVNGHWHHIATGYDSKNQS